MDAELLTLMNHLIIIFLQAKDGFQNNLAHLFSLTLSQTTNFRTFKIERVCRRQVLVG